MRQWIYERVREVGLAMPSNHIHGAASADSPTKPFAIIRLGNVVRPTFMPASSRTFELPFDVWLHDAEGSLSPVIDPGINLLRNALPLAAPAQFNGTQIMECRWESDSVDLFDDHYGTSVRYGSYRIYARE